jgi:SPP1 gp7 family putative phage head morphogenesis protein
MPGSRSRGAKAAKQKAAFSKVRRAERQYARQLRKVARHVGDIVKGHEVDSEQAAAALRDTLDKYAHLIEPWAKAQAGRMLADVGKRDEKAWDEHSKMMGRELRLEIATAPTGQLLQAKLAANVKLIKSLPAEAGQRIQKLALESLFNASRSSEVAKEIARSGEVTASRANLIARTEVAGAASGLVEARARHVGSEGYIWRTAGDSDVRPSHRKMAGKFVAWDSPPTLDGMTGHAGHFPNCRCYCEPVIPEFL